MTCSNSAVLEESTGLIVSRQLLSDFAASLEADVAQPKEAKKIPIASFKQVCQVAIEAMHPRINSFEDQVSA